MRRGRAGIAACGVLILLLGCGGSARDAGPIEVLSEWTLVEDLRIDPGTADLTGVGTMLVTRRGDMVVSQPRDHAIRVYAEDGAYKGGLGRHGAGPGEFQLVNRIGTLGDSIWLIDASLRRITVYGPSMEFVRSIANPQAILETGPENPIPSMAPYALLPDGSLRANSRPYPNTAPPVWLADVGANQSAAIRIDTLGNHLSRITLLDGDPCRISWTFGTGGFAGTTRPFCAKPIDTSLDGTTDLGIVLPDSVEGRASYRVLVITPSGDTMVNRSFDYSPIAVTQAQFDSIAAFQREIDAMSAPYTRANRPPITPAPYLPPVLRLVLGRDGTVWLEEEDGFPTHQWLVLSSGGEPIGRVALPENAKLRVAERGIIWATITDDDDLVGMVRYRVLPPDRTQSP